MSREVRLLRPGQELAGYLAGRAVRGVQWQEQALAANWLGGRGRQLVSAHLGSTTALVGGHAFVYRWRVVPSQQAVERVWVVLARSAGNDACDVSVSAPSTGTAQVFRAPVTREEARPWVIREILAAQSATEAVIDLEITPDAAIYVDSIACWEMPRHTLAAGSDLGTDPVLLGAGQPVLHPSVTGLVAVAADADTAVRRHLLQWAVPVTDDAAVTTAYAYATSSASYVDMLALAVPILGRKGGRAATTRAISAKVLAWSAASSIDVRLTTTSGGSSSAANIASATPAWSSAITHTVDCEDLAAADGRQTAGVPAWDTVQLEVKANGGTTARIAAVSIWET